MKYLFKNLELDTNLLELKNSDGTIALEPQVFSLLKFLVENRDRVVSKDEIIEEIWQGRIISDTALSTRINAVRIAVGDDGKKQEIVRTFPRRGFRFVAEVTVVKETLNRPKRPEKSDQTISNSKLTPPSSISQLINLHRWTTVSGLSKSNGVKLGVLLLAVIFIAWIWLIGSGGDKKAQNRPVIAVLPFKNLSSDPSQEYFTDGVTEDIIIQLSKFRLFSVVGRNSTFTYKNKNVDSQKISEELNAQYLLEGSIQKSENRIRINVQLIDATSDKNIWTESYDRQLKDVFEIQDDITEKIVAAVAPKYVSAEFRRVQRTPPPNLDAWDAMIRGYWHFLRFTKPDNIEAQRMFQKSISLDPGQAKALSMLAMTDLIGALYGWHESRQAAMISARLNAEKAIAIDQEDPLVVRARGIVSLFSKNHMDALADFKQAILLNPNEAESHALLGAAYGALGNYDKALSSFETAMELSPRDQHIATWYNYLAMAAITAGAYEQAADWAKKSIQANPKFPGGYRSLAASLGNMNKLDEAQGAAKKLRELLPDVTLNQLRINLPFFNEETHLDRYLTGLRNAGLPEN